jgi:hypothetical protein
MERLVNYSGKDATLLHPSSYDIGDYKRKPPTFSQKSPTFFKKSPRKFGKSPTFFRFSPTFLDSLAKDNKDRFENGGHH